MRKATRKKLDDILVLVKKGADKKEIAKVKFNRSKKAYDNWLDGIKNELTKGELEILSLENKTEVVEVTKTNQLEVITVISDHEERIKQLEEIMLNNIGKTTTEKEITNILNIDNQIINLKSDVKSIRINKELIQEFNKIADNNPTYTKTTLLNFALYEFINKYK